MKWPLRISCRWFENARCYRIAQGQNDLDAGIVPLDPVWRRRVTEIGRRNLADRPGGAGLAEMPFIPAIAPIIIIAEEIQFLGMADKDLGVIMENLVDPSGRALLGANAEEGRPDHRSTSGQRPGSRWASGLVVRPSAPGSNTVFSSIIASTVPGMFPSAIRSREVAIEAAPGHLPLI